jgi:hypothetical protein
MAPFALIEILRRVLANRYVLLALLAAAAFAAGYLKGVSHERGRQASRLEEEVVQQQEEVARSEVVKQELEVAHDKRVRKILSRDVPEPDIARMLSRWPDEEAAPAAP